MISLPDELLARVDARASERGSIRSATIRELAEAAFGQREQTESRTTSLTFLDASVLLAAEDVDDANHDASAALLKTGAHGEPAPAGTRVGNR